MTQTVILTKENILDVYLEFGMPEELYNLLTERATPEAKQIIHKLTVDGLEHLQDKHLPIEQALQVVFAAIVDAIMKP
jgi:hypothetical protein